MLYLKRKALFQKSSFKKHSYKTTFSCRKMNIAKLSNLYLTVIGIIILSYKMLIKIKSLNVKMKLLHIIKLNIIKNYIGGYYHYYLLFYFCIYLTIIFFLIIYINGYSYNCINFSFTVEYLHWNALYNVVPDIKVFQNPHLLEQHSDT